MSKNGDLIIQTLGHLNYIFTSFGFGLYCSNESQTEVGFAEPKDPCLHLRESTDFYCDIAKQLKQTKTVKGGDPRIRIVTNAGIYTSKVASAKLCATLKQDLAQCLKEFKEALK